MGNIDKIIDFLLLQYNKIFEEPKELTLIRSRDHKINLREGMVPKSIRLYLYPFYQKLEMIL